MSGLTMEGQASEVRDSTRFNTAIFEVDDQKFYFPTELDPGNPRNPAKQAMNSLTRLTEVMQTETTLTAIAKKSKGSGFDGAVSSQKDAPIW